MRPLHAAEANLFHAIPARLSARVRFNAWRESVTVQVSRRIDRVVVAHLVAQSRDSLTISVRRLGMAVGWRSQEGHLVYGNRHADGPLSPENQPTGVGSESFLCLVDRINPAIPASSPM